MAVETFVRNFDIVEVVDGKSTIVFDTKPKYIMGRDGFINIEEYYSDVIFDDVYSLEQAIEEGLVDLTKLNEYEYIMQHFTLPKIEGKVILDTDNPEVIDVVGRTDSIKELELSKGIELEREMVWLNGAESTSGVIILPYDDYSKVYVIEGDDPDNPQNIRFIDEYVEGMERPYYIKQNGETHIYVNHFSGGGGTQDDPYLIHTRADLEAIPNNPSAHYKMMEDIDLSDADWVSIPFSGVFNGNGKVISNITINTPSGDTTNWSGFFKNLANGGSILKLGLENVNISTYSHRSGALVANVSGSSTIKECYATNVFVTCNNTSSTYIAGFVGNLGGASLIEDCFYQGEVTIGKNANSGGFVGYLSGHGTSIRRCIAVSKVNNPNNVAINAGGIFFGGSSTAVGTIPQMNDCYYDSDVAGSSAQNGSIFYGSLYARKTSELQTPPFSNAYLNTGLWEQNNGEYPKLLAFKKIVRNVGNFALQAYTNTIQSSNNKLFSKLVNPISKVKNITSRAFSKRINLREVKAYAQNIISRSGFGLNRFINVLSFAKPIKSSSSRKVAFKRNVESFMKPVRTKLDRKLQTILRAVSRVGKINGNLDREVIKTSTIKSIVKPIVSSSIGFRIKSVIEIVKSTVKPIVTSAKIGVLLSVQSFVKSVSTNTIKSVRAIKIPKAYVRRIRGRAGKVREFIIRVKSRTRVITARVSRTFKFAEGRFIKVYAYITESFQKTKTRVRIISNIASKNDSVNNSDISDTNSNNITDDNIKEVD